MQKVYELVREGVPVSRLKPAKRAVTVKAILLRITTITGWIVPEKEMYNILLDQLGKIICEQYANLSDQEIEYAFREYGLTVKDWGKDINLAMMHEVMYPYIQLRNEVGKWEENQHRPPETEEEKNISDETMNNWMEDQRQKINDGKLAVNFLPVMLYEYAIKKELINPTNKEKREYLVRAANYTQVKLANLATDKDGMRELSEFNEMFKEGEFHGKYIDQLKNLAKKMILFIYLKNSSI